MDRLTFEKLKGQFPALYRNMRDECSILCESGWYNLIYDLSIKLERLRINELEVVQVKQKWGTLSVVTNISTDKVSQILEEIESKSNSICEKCGTADSHLYYKKLYRIVLCSICASKDIECLRAPLIIAF